MTLSVIDVSIANVGQSAGCDTNDCIQDLAATWIEDNRVLVDGWIQTAMDAA